MQPMFSSAVRSQFSMQFVNAHYCRCMANSHRHSSISRDNHVMDPRNEGRRCGFDGDAVNVGDGNSTAAIDHSVTTKDLGNQKIESPSAR